MKRLCLDAGKIIFKAQFNSCPEGQSHDFHQDPSHMFSFLFMLSTHCQLIKHTHYICELKCDKILLIIRSEIQLKGQTQLSNSVITFCLTTTSSNKTRQSITLFLEHSQWRPINRSAIERPSAS